MSRSEKSADFLHRRRVFSRESIFVHTFLALVTLDGSFWYGKGRGEVEEKECKSLFNNHRDMD